MKTKTEDFEAELSASIIDEFSDKIRAFLTSQKFSNSDIVRYALTCEEIMLKTMETFGEGVPVTLSFGVKFLRPFINIKIRCDAYNVFSDKENMQGVLGSGILKNLGLSPDYTYGNNENSYFFRIRKKSLNPLVTFAIAVSAAAIFGSVGMLFPEWIRSALLTNVFEPLHDGFSNVLGCIAGPMIFIAVAWGIYGIGDVATLKRIGQRMIRSYIRTLYLFVCLFSVIGLFVFNLNFAPSGGRGSLLKSLFSLILGVIPKSIFSPFIEGNMLQIIFLAAIIGIAMLFLSHKTTTVARTIEQINYIIEFIVEFISKLVPYFIFIVITSMIWSGSVGIFLRVIKLFAVFLGMVAAMFVIYLGYTSIRNRVSPFIIVKKGWPTLFAALTTVSLAATFGSNVKACKNQFGIDDSISSFGISLGMVTFKPTTAIGYLAIALFYAEIYKIEISVSWVLIMIFAVGILAVATPAVPGGALTAYTILFAQLGIPAEAIAVILAVDTIFDFINTGIDQFLIPVALLNQSAKLGMVNRKILKKL